MKEFKRLVATAIYLAKIKYQCHGYDVSIKPELRKDEIDEIEHALDVEVFNKALVKVTFEEALPKFHTIVDERRPSYLLNAIMTILYRLDDEMIVNFENYDINELEVDGYANQFVCTMITTVDAANDSKGIKKINTHINNVIDGNNVELYDVFKIEDAEYDPFSVGNFMKYNKWLEAIAKS